MELTQQTLKSVLAYDAETGLFNWRNDIGSRARKGGLAGSITLQGYIAIRINGIPHLSHRLAWLYVFGEWPQEHIDHINGNRSDNRISNLRHATRSQNLANSRKSRSNSTGYKGVCFQKKYKKYMAYIRINNKRKYLGLFNTAEDAHAAYCEAAKLNFGDFARFD